ncbi:2-oxoacid:acceptor oxidoreductase subunit alpha [Pelosinus sp. UFO1]|uniref:2-oxoacid:acceptor oxidoreductase subunit alpha n=1 Tax=Pelosinus sp. UFO1 TaxID=484770 RepID=UPI0004D1937F|nr:2-oxoacid:acceptor oxidoreductase subunit alpha [Pelosinus sp. UFO1]AIF50515.1 2-oxoacid:acceptor oxidoreductase, alpha subunit [Pelosinus sp. UFO1]
MNKSYYTCLFGGEAGYGVMSAGSIIAKGANRSGLWSFVVNEYPSLIQGGLNSCLVRLSNKPITAYEETIDFLGLFSQQAFDCYADKLSPSAIVLYDAATTKIDATKVPEGTLLCPVALASSIPKGGAKIMINSAMLGAFAAFTGYPKQVLIDVMKTEFHNEKVQQENIQILDEVYHLVMETLSSSKVFPFPFEPKAEPKMLINGNEAISIAAIKAGCKFSAGYPMTPGSSVLSYLADHGAEYGLVFKQAEDEIAAINMLIGASFAGTRAIGSTSGGGFALMVEALGFAAQAEIPLVMVNAQRGGPSTGLPTRTAQADLNFVVHASQGEFPRIVLAPGDIEECFYETFRIFNLADTYQVPCIILTDKFLADSSVSQLPFATDSLTIERGKLFEAKEQPYLRYENTPDGVSARAIPGQVGGRHIATSYTHGEDGFYSSGNKEYALNEPMVTINSMDKLYNKLPAMEKEIPAIKFYGPPNADLTIIAWGSTKGAILEAMELAASQNISVNFLQILYISPFPITATELVLQQAKKTLLIEGNKTAQLGSILRANTGHKTDYTFLKYNSRAFLPSEILAKIKEVLF